MPADTNAPFGYTDNLRPIPGGFTGTLSAFLTWLSQHLTYGGVQIGEPEPDEYRPKRMIRKVCLVTGGYSDDESLLGRVRRSMFAMRFWESDHRGGLSVYHVPVAELDSEKDIRWLDDPSATFETIARARTLIVRTPVGDTITFAVPYGVELDFTEPDRDVAQPAGEITVRAIAEQDSIWGSLDLHESA